jgi:transcriptional regulator with XRE-family HTH domain
MRTAANIRRIRQERGLSYAELSRRLVVTGHPILDTGLLKIEKGERRVDVDDLVALAVALETTPNRLLLPGSDIELAPATHHLTPDITSTPPLMWAWATGEVPLGHPPARATDDIKSRVKEIAFNRENRTQRSGLAHWPSPPAVPRPSGFDLVAVGINAFITEAFRRLFSTQDIRAIVEGAITNAVLSPDPMHETMIEVTEDRRVSFRLNAPLTSEEGA